MRLRAAERIMDDKQFNELMENYVSSTKLGKDVAFEKLNECDRPAPARVKKNRKIWLYAAVSSLCLIILVLSIVLPVTLLPKDDGTDDGQDEITYLDSGDFGVSLIEPTEVFDLFGSDLLLPAALGSDMFAAAFTSKEDGSTVAIQIIGYIPQCGEIEVMIMPKGTVFSSYAVYLLMKNTLDWRGCSVKYADSDAYNGMPKGYRMYFNNGDYDYFINITSFKADSVLQAMDLIFGEEN